MAKAKRLSVREVSLRAGFRSGLEEQTAADITSHDVPFAYEKMVLPYRVEETRKYTPDFVLLHNGIVVETKGRWVTGDRKKIRLIRAQYPDLDLRIVFSNARSRISKQSKTTYAAFCDAQGIPYADKKIPASWYHEKPNHKSLEVIRAFTKES